jgi:N-methylhydantoinase B
MAHSVIRRADGTEEVIPSKIVTRLKAGDRLTVETAGGGGYGDPGNRSPERISEDAANGKI